MKTKEFTATRTTASSLINQYDHYANGDLQRIAAAIQQIAGPVITHYGFGSGRMGKPLKEFLKNYPGWETQANITLVENKATAYYAVPDGGKMIPLFEIEFDIEKDFLVTSFTVYYVSGVGYSYQNELDYDEVQDLWYPVRVVERGSSDKEDSVKKFQNIQFDCSVGPEDFSYDALIDTTTPSLLVARHSPDGTMRTYRFNVNGELELIPDKPAAPGVEVPKDNAGIP